MLYGCTTLRVKALIGYNSHLNVFRGWNVCDMIPADALWEREERKRGGEESGVREEQDDMKMIMGLINPFHLQLLTSWDLRVVEFDCLHGDGLHWNPRGTSPTCTERKRRYI